MQNLPPETHAVTKTTWRVVDIDVIILYYKV